MLTEVSSCDAPRRRDVFSDLIGKLGVLRIECAKCGRSDKYRLAALIAQYAATRSCSPGRTS